MDNLSKTQSGEDIREILADIKWPRTDVFRFTVEYPSRTCANCHVEIETGYFCQQCIATLGPKE